MQSSTIEFNQNSRRVFTGVKHVLTTCGEFRSIKIDERNFRITASHGLPIWGEDIMCKVAASGSTSSKVVIESSDKLFFNIFKWGNNKENVGNLSDFIQNEIYRYLSSAELGIQNQLGDTSQIKIVEPKIKFK